MGEGVGRAELVRLFTGDLEDDLWQKYHSFRLGRAICDACHPDSIEALVIVVYGPIPTDEIPGDAIESLTRAFGAYSTAERRKRRRKEKV